MPKKEEEMLNRVYIENISQWEGKEVELKGWVFNKVKKGKLFFLTLRDGTGFLQITYFKPNLSEGVFDKLKSLTLETAVSVKGKVKAEPRAQGGYELEGIDVEIISYPEEEYPLGMKKHGVGFLMDNRHLWLRTKRQNAIMRIRDTIIWAAQEFLHKNGFLRVDSPVLTPTACEGTTTLFEVQYFDTQAYLTQSGQLYGEASAMAYGKIYCFGPAFRAEKSKTRRHLTEFWMIEPEVAFMDLDENMQLQEEFLTYIVKSVLNKNRTELEILERDISILEKIEPPFPRLSYDEAVKRINELGLHKEWGDDFGAEEETKLAELFDKPFFVHRFPSAIKAFYMKPDPERPEVSLCSDMLAPEGYGEIIGGGQRLEDYNLLRQRIKEHELPEEAFDWYLDLRKFGSVPHGGFGLGIERTVAWICKLPHVRETIPFPRMLYRLTP
jgi:asparaginyl-tRNA synthetase